MTFIEKAKAVHGNKYDYSLAEYVSAKTKLKIICKEHGVFEQQPQNHLDGRGCHMCANNQTYTRSHVIKKFKKAHGNKYDYSKAVINGVLHPTKIICPKHGLFEQEVRSHFRGSGCGKCAGRGLTRDEMIDELNIIHDGKYDYTHSVFKTARDKVKITCKMHGDFMQLLFSHRKGSGCPSCKSSKGEKAIQRFLVNNNIVYVRQKYFEGCKNPKTSKYLLFDFYLPEMNVCIEYDGEQHFKKGKQFCSSKGNQASLLNNQYRDSLKNKFCSKNKIPLLRIPYTKLKKIDSVLQGFLNIDAKNDKALPT